jgi:uncharacterized integral membrane protein
MMVLSFNVIGIQQIILLFLVGKTANIEFGTNMVVNFIIPLHMIMLSQVLSGHLMETILQLDLLKCLDYAINQDGLIPLINHNVDQFYH